MDTLILRDTVEITIIKNVTSMPNLTSKSSIDSLGRSWSYTSNFQDSLIDAKVFTIIDGTSYLATSTLQYRFKKPLYNIIVKDSTSIGTTISKTR